MTRSVRNELKYIIPYHTKNRLLALWHRYLKADSFTDENNRTNILSQYYDTSDMRFYTEKLDGLSFRNKVRLRTYGTEFKEGALAFLEIKQRVWDEIRKIRHRIDSFEFDLLSPENWTFISHENKNSFGILQERQALYPSAQVWYQREAYDGVADSNLRVTFDSCLLGLYPNEKWKQQIHDPSRLLIPENNIVLEVKSTGDIPYWVASGVKECGLTLRPVSKYVLAVEKLGLHHNSFIDTGR